MQDTWHCVSALASGKGTLSLGKQQSEVAHGAASLGSDRTSCIWCENTMLTLIPCPQQEETQQEEEVGSLCQCFFLDM